MPQTTRIRHFCMAAVLLLTACQNRDIKVAEESVKSYLKDPDSVKFRNVKVVDDGVCGEYNAKNSYGGYIGFRPFSWPKAAPENTIAIDENGKVFQFRDPTAEMFPAEFYFSSCTHLFKGGVAE